jgi:VanZ family protein
MFTKIAAVASWIVLGFIVYATIAPIQDRPTLPASSSFEHLAAFALLGALFCFGYPRHIVLVCMIVLGSAVLLELAQILTPDRHARVPDALEKMSGGVAGIAAARTLLAFARAPL